jgi:hypothetical protein
MTTAPSETASERLDDAAAMAMAKVMADELNDLRPGLQVYEDYYAGIQAMPTEPRRLTQAHADLLAMSVSNWTRLIVDVVNERLVVGGIKSSQNADLDEDAWGYWQANNLDFHSPAVHLSALKFAYTYTSVWPREQGLPPRIQGESPLQVHVRRDEITGEPTAAIKVWEGASAPRSLYVSLYRPEGVYRFRSTQPLEALDKFIQRAPQTVDLSAIDIVPRDPDDDGGPFLDNPMKKVPFVWFPTQPDLMGSTSSEIAGVIPIQDRINRTTFHRLLTQEFHAFPQRWVTGIDIPVDPDTNQPVSPFDSEVDRLWTAFAPETQFGQFPAASPDGFLNANREDIQALATQSRTPPHYLTAGMGNFPSGESVRATEYGLSRKVGNRRATYGEAWADTIRLAALAAGNQSLAEDLQIGVVWEDVEARSEGEIVDALLKMATLGVPRKVLWERWGASPTEAARWEDMLATEATNEAGLGLAIGQGTAVVPPGTPKPTEPPKPAPGQ